MKPTAILSFSGGMDSTGLFLHLLSQGYHVIPVSFIYGQKHAIEVERAGATVNKFMKGDFSVSPQRVLDLSPVMGGFHSALIEGGAEIPEGHYEQDNMKATVVPNRNAIFASILYGLALSEALKRSEHVVLALGVHSGDHAVYPDCRSSFYDLLADAFEQGNWDSDKVSFYLPFMSGDKESILKDSLTSCDLLGLEFDSIFASTHTSYNPDGELSSGKSGADVERILAFHAIGRKDPVRYQGGWDAVLTNALEVQSQWRDKKDDVRDA